nr:MAG TPA: hypothetical protein [Caudoviricetes sp.]
MRNKCCIVRMFTRYVTPIRYADIPTLRTPKKRAEQPF